MARARNIKPGYLTNEILGCQCSLEAHFLFGMLPMIADRMGRLEDRPARIKIQIFPWRSVNVEALLDELAAKGNDDFIQRYEVDGHRYIQITNFVRHQRPHSNEASSRIPPPPRGVQTTTAHQGELDFALNDESLNDERGIINPPPTPPAIAATQNGMGWGNSNHQTQSNGVREHHPKPPGTSSPATSRDRPGASDGPGPRPDRQPQAATVSDEFEKFWSAYPRRIGKQRAKAIWAQLAPDASLVGLMLNAIERHRHDPQWQRENGRYIPHPSTWLEQRRWEDDPLVKDDSRVREILERRRLDLEEKERCRQSANGLTFRELRERMEEEAKTVSQ